MPQRKVLCGIFQLFAAAGAAGFYAPFITINRAINYHLTLTQPNYYTHFNYFTFRVVLTGIYISVIEFLQIYLYFSIYK
jgi:hypothetical protein